MPAEPPRDRSLKRAKPPTETPVADAPSAETSDVLYFLTRYGDWTPIRTKDCRPWTGDDPDGKRSTLYYARYRELWALDKGTGDSGRELVNAYRATAWFVAHEIELPAELLNFEREGHPPSSSSSSTSSSSTSSSSTSSRDLKYKNNHITDPPPEHLRPWDFYPDPSSSKPAIGENDKAPTPKELATESAPDDDHANASRAKGPPQINTMLQYYVILAIFKARPNGIRFPGADGIEAFVEQSLKHEKQGRKTVTRRGAEKIIKPYRDAGLIENIRDAGYRVCDGKEDEVDRILKIGRESLGIPN